MIRTKIDKLYQSSIVVIGIFTILFNILTDNRDALLIGLFGLIFLMIFYSLYLKFYDVRFKKVKNN